MADEKTGGFLVRWMALEGRFVAIGRTWADSLKDAMELIRLAYPEAKIADGADEEYGEYRVTARSLGGRPGRNVAFIEEHFAGIDRTEV